MKLLRLVVPLVLLAPGLAQDAPQSNAKKTPELSPQEQLARNILNSAEASAGALGPISRSYICYQASRGITKYDRAGAKDLLGRCLLASQSIEEDEKQIRQQIQTWIVAQLLTYGAEATEEYLPQLEGRARENVRSRLIDAYAEKGKYDRAIALVQGIRPEEEKFPWSSVAKLMQRLPKDMAGERQSLFSQALAHFTNQPPQRGYYYFEDLGTLVVRFGSVMPKNLTLEAIDALLKSGKDADAKREDKLDITLRGKENSATFYSYYDFRLFQVLPVLRELDPSRAESLLKENQQTKALLAQMPDGLRTIEPGRFNATPPEKENHDISVSFRTGSGGDDGTETEQFRYRIRKAAEDATALAVKNPKQAIAAALSLPTTGPRGMTPRATTLVAIARQLREKNPSAAKDALDEMIKSVREINYMAQMGRLSEAASLLLKMEEPEAAAKFIKSGMELGKLRFQEDTNATDPNTAPRIFWPSAGVWRAFVIQSGKVSPQMGLESVKEIQDADIQLASQVALANSWLNLPNGELLIREVHENGENDWSQLDDDEQ